MISKQTPYDIQLLVFKENAGLLDLIEKDTAQYHLFLAKIKILFSVGCHAIHFCSAVVKE